MLSNLNLQWLAVMLFASLPAFATAAEVSTGQAEKENTTVKVLMQTNVGDIVLELNKEKAPITVDNFLAYVNNEHYNGTIFHRVIKNFMIQGGGMDENMQMKPMRAPIKNEAKNGLKNVRGSIAMARTSVVDSATSQFFINTKNNIALNHGERDYGYAVFGQVVEGMDVVDRIEKSKTTRRDVPVTPIIIESVSTVAP